MATIAQAAGPTGTVQVVGQGGGPIKAIAVQGSYAYIGSGPRLAIVDISNPASPAIVGRSAILPDTVRGVSVANTRAYRWVRVVGQYAFVGRMEGISNPVNVPVLPGDPTQVNITTKPQTFRAEEPAVSPDGTQVAYTLHNQTVQCYVEQQMGSAYYTTQDVPTINVAGLDGSGETVLTPSSPTLIEVPRFPDWSPDGARIAYSDDVVDLSGSTWLSGIYTVGPDGGGKTQITAPRAGFFILGYTQDAYPAWSPDSQKIAFTHYDAADFINGTGDIYVVNANGSGPRKLTTFPTGYYAERPTWSPDGNRIGFQVRTGGMPGAGSTGTSYNIYVVNADGTGLAQITNDGVSGMPAWRK